VSRPRRNTSRCFELILAKVNEDVNTAQSPASRLALEVSGERNGERRTVGMLTHEQQIGIAVER
jgi:hypothetical protein